jgi:hypothetical protein
VECPDEARPIPPRYVWLRRFVVLGVVLVAIAIGVQVCWGRLAESRLQAAIAMYRAAGEPVLVKDFVMETVPDDENAAPLLEKAAADVVAKVGKVYMGDFLADPQFARDHAQELHDLLAANEAVLALYHEACSRPRADWGVVLASPMYNVTWPSVFSQQKLARLGTLDARQHHAAGDDAAVVARLRDMQAHGRHVGEVGPFLLAHLIHISIEHLVVTTIEQAAPDLRIAGAATEGGADGTPAARQDVEAVLAALLEEEWVPAGWRLAFCGERLSQIDTILYIVNTPRPMAGLSRSWRSPVAALAELSPAKLLMPAWKLDAVRIMANSSALAEAGAAPNWPAGEALLPPPLFTGEESLPEQVSRLFSIMFVPALRGTLSSQFVTLAERRMAATALALRLYEIDHGRRPATLAELVPNYLPAVPRDPFAADDRPLVYLPDADPPVLYSTAVNGVDDGGRFAFDRSGEIDEEELDLPFFLDGQRPMNRKP